MNRLLFSFYFAFCVTAIFAQNCYRVTRNQGINAFNEGKFQEASDIFKRAVTCKDKPGTHDLRQWIIKCNDSIAARPASATTPEVTKETPAETAKEAPAPAVIPVTKPATGRNWWVQKQVLDAAFTPSNILLTINNLCAKKWL